MNVRKKVEETLETREETRTTERKKARRCELCVFGGTSTELDS